MMREELHIDEIVLNSSNPRYITEENLQRLTKSIQEDPELLFIRPIVIDQDNVILGGNMRYKAARKLGYDKVWVVRTDFTDEQKKEFIIKDNVNNGIWDFDLIKELFDTEQVLDWGVEIPLWEDIDTKSLYQDFIVTEDEKETDNSTRVYTTFTFRYEEELTDRVKNKLLETASTPEQALYQLLGL